MTFHPALRCTEVGVDFSLQVLRHFKSIAVADSVNRKHTGHRYFSVAQHHGHRSCNAGTGARSTDKDSTRIKSQIRTVVDCPFGNGQGIQLRHWESNVVGADSIIDLDDECLRALGDFEACDLTLWHIHVATDECSAVHPNQ